MKKLLYALLISLAFGNAVSAADGRDALLSELVNELGEIQKGELLEEVEKTTFQKVVGVPAAFVKIAKKHPKFVIGALSVIGAVAVSEVVVNRYGKDDEGKDKRWAKPNTKIKEIGRSLGAGVYKYSGAEKVKNCTKDFRANVSGKCVSAKDGVVSAADTTYGYAWRDHGKPVKGVITVGTAATIVLLYKYIKKHHPGLINKIAGIADLRLIEA